VNAGTNGAVCTRTRAVLDAMDAAKAQLRNALLDGGDTAFARENLAELGRELAALHAAEAAQLAGVEQRERAEVERTARAIADDSLAKLNAGLAILEPRPAPTSASAAIFTS
jgi:hypothetical protein